MTKTILIPTDFTVNSLNLVKIALQENYEKNYKLRIILVHGAWMPTSITELLFYSKRDLLDKLQTDEFRSSCQLLQGKYEDKIEQMSIDIFSGRNQAAFTNFLEANKVDEGYISTNYKIKLKHSRSFDIIPFFNRSKINLIEANWNSIETARQESWSDELSALFFNRGQIAH